MKSRTNKYKYNLPSALKWLGTLAHTLVGAALKVYECRSLPPCFPP